MLVAVAAVAVWMKVGSSVYSSTVRKRDEKLRNKPWLGAEAELRGQISPRKLTPLHCT